MNADLTLRHQVLATFLGGRISYLPATISEAWAVTDRRGPVSSTAAADAASPAGNQICFIATRSWALSARYRSLLTIIRLPRESRIRRSIELSLSRR